MTRRGGPTGRSWSRRRTQTALRALQPKARASAPKKSRSHPMSWTNSDLARPDTLYRDHFQRAEERLKVNAHTTLGRHHPVPPITRASDDSALTHAPGQPIARPARDATPGAASSGPKPRTIGSHNGAPLTGHATH